VLSKNSPISVVSHSFRLVIIRAFIKTKGHIVDDPFLIYDYMQSGQKTFTFEEKFSFAEEDLSFSIL
jgi:hypothetical protein